MQHSFSKVLLLCVTIVFFASCDKDFNELGADIVGDDHYGLGIDTTSTVVAYNQKLGTVQTNKTTTSTLNLPINTLGYYNNPVFGKTKASFVTQLELTTLNPTFINPVVKKVELTIPYFSRRTDTDEDGNNIYELDSIKGNAKIKLSVYASNYYLRDLDPASGFQDVQKYYSDQSADFDNNIDPLLTTRLNDVSDDVSQNDQFFFNPAEIVTYEDVDGEQVVDTRTAPQMQLKLNNAFFQQKIFGAGASGKLVNNNTFKEYFRGLYFKVENADNSPDQGTMAQLNFRAGKITITYDGATSSSDSTPIEKTFVINLAGNTVNLFENEESSQFVTAMTNADLINGDERLYLKGGAGSMAVIDLFGSADLYQYSDTDNDSSTPNVIVNSPNGVSDELDDIREKKWQVNEANLIFTIDKTAPGMATAPEPQRVYLYDLTNNRPLVDYFTDVTTVGANPKRNKYIHGGYIEEGSDNRGVRYKIRITDHIRTLVKADVDSTNVRLGLVVTESIGNTSNAWLKTPVSPTIKRVPAASVGNPLGTVLYGSKILPNAGSNPGQPYKNRLKLVIYYTKPD